MKLILKMERLGEGLGGDVQRLWNGTFGSLAVQDAVRCVDQVMESVDIGLLKHDTDLQGSDGILVEVILPLPKHFSVKGTPAYEFEIIFSIGQNKVRRYNLRSVAGDYIDIVNSRSIHMYTDEIAEALAREHLAAQKCD